MRNNSPTAAEARQRTIKRRLKPVSLPAGAFNRKTHMFHRLDLFPYSGPRDPQVFGKNFQTMKHVGLPIEGTGRQGYRLQAPFDSSLARFRGSRGIIPHYALS